MLSEKRKREIDAEVEAEAVAERVPDTDSEPEPSSLENEKKTLPFLQEYGAELNALAKGAAVVLVIRAVFLLGSIYIRRSRTSSEPTGQPSQPGPASGQPGPGSSGP